MSLLGVQPTPSVSFSHSNTFQNGYIYISFWNPLIIIKLWMKGGGANNTCMLLYSNGFCTIKETGYSKSFSLRIVGVVLIYNSQKLVPPQ